MKETNREYEIKLYHSDLMPQVVNLLQHLWGNVEDGNLSYFKWKYVDNPYTERPPGIVAIHKGQVIGFRGYFATKWQIHKNNYSIIVLCPGDTCVHPNHRRKGLSVTMGKMAMEEYALKYKVFFNFSSTKNSVPGYLKIGFVPFVKKTYLTRCSLLGLVKFSLTAKKIANLHEGNFSFGEFDDIIVTDSPRPEEMSAVITNQNSDGSRITLFQDEDFFRWRYNNKRNKYIFYYHRKDNAITGYVVIGVTPNNRRGYILDYAENDGKALDSIFRYVIKMRHFDIFSIYNFGLNDKLLRILNGLRFNTNGLTQRIERFFDGEWPLLIRPVAKRFVDNDWFIEDLDIRKVESWEIKPICSDAT